MNKIPISLVKSSPVRYKLVEWKLGNTCNYDCSFCGDENKIGNERWFDIEVYKNVCKNLMDQSELQNKKMFFQFTGGEPTLYPKLLELFQFIASRGHYIKMFSNGSRTLRWWKELADANVLNTLLLTVHVEQNPNIDHIIDIVKLFQSKPVYVLVQCTAPINVFNEAFSAHQKILQKSVVCSSLKPINIGTRTHTSYIQKYTSEQLGIFKTNEFVKSDNYNQLKTHPSVSTGSPMKITYSDNSTEVSSCYNLLSSGLNSFQGWDCSIGIDYMVIDYDKIYRGVCKEGNVIGTIHDEITEFQKTTVVCTKQRCICLSDLGENKVK